ncbi:MAG: zinc metalloprotease HtpX [Chloroflexi bacterium]|nr:zinc metalloprotease HtpX [Chloroflexota bacterium]|tara:strand:+ start:134514 stop:135479 length:966 start_codon:yes stop_codon:yes gene_type:complete
MHQNMGRDRSLTIRMAFTFLMLFFVYLFFIGVLITLGVPFMFTLGFAIVMSIFQYYGSDKLVLMATKAKVVTYKEEPALHEIIERLSLLAEIPKPKKIAVMDSHVPNAFATGRNPKNSVVAVTKGLMSKLNKKELEAVIAHELSHIKNRDVMVLTWASVIVIMAGYLLQMMVFMSIFGGFGGHRRNNDSGQLGMIIMVAFAVTILVYFISQILIMALSRYREFSADLGGAYLTGEPLHLASALTKISSDMNRIPEKDMRQIEHASAFFIIPAIKSNTVAKLFSSHPKVEDRIKKLNDIQKNLDSRKFSNYEPPYKNFRQKK